MSKSHEMEGRFCNNLIRNICMSKLAEKNSVYFEYSNLREMNALGITLFSSEVQDDDLPLSLVDDDNFMELLTSETRTNILFTNPRVYFQSKEHNTFFYKNLLSQKRSIIARNPYKNLYGNNNSCFVHIRLGDVPQHNPGIEYYRKALNQLKFDVLYIASDSMNHPLVHQLFIEYPNSLPLFLNEVRTIQFASSCRHIVLSHGSFSACIGYLGFYSDVYYPSFKNMNIWHGDLFSISGWNCVEFK
jgi:hypothetical protein